MSRDQFTHTITRDGKLRITKLGDPQPIIVHAQPDFGPFQGVGAFTYGSPEVVIPHLDLLDWVAVLPSASRDTNTQISGAFNHGKMFTWDSASMAGWLPTDTIANDGWIGQAEDAGELEACIRNKPMSRVALVGNPTAADTLPTDVVWLNEVYENSNPTCSILGLDYEARKRGATKVLPCFGIYHEGEPGTSSYVAQFPLSHYLNELDNLPAAMQTLLGSPPSFSFWTAEQLTDEDWQALKDWRSRHAKAAA